MGLEELDLSPRDERPADPSEELLRFSGEHHSADNFDPTFLGSVVHLAFVDKGRRTTGAKVRSFS